MRAQAAMDAIVARLRKDLPKNLFYHTVDHTLDVLDRVISLGEAEGVSQADITLLKTAACYHDCGFLVNNRNHEKLGCRIARSDLPGYGFSQRQIAEICGMIMATKIPQRPRNLLQRIICDADLDYLGRTDFVPIGQKLFRELKAFRLLKTEAEWNRLQISFLEAHDYWTATNIQERTPLKNIHLATLKSEN